MGNQHSFNDALLEQLAQTTPEKAAVSFGRILETLKNGAKAVLVWIEKQTSDHTIATNKLFELCM